MCAVAELAPLAGLEIHALIGDIPQRPPFVHDPISAIEQIDRNVKLASERAGGAGQALKQDFNRGAALQARQLRLDVAEHADLGRHAVRAPQLVEMRERRRHVLHVVDGRIQADERIAGAQ